MIPLNSYIKNYMIEALQHDNNINQLICEGAFTEHFDTSTEFIKFLAKFKNISDLVIEFVEYTYNYWKMVLQEASNSTPFRCTSRGDFKLARIYYNDDFLKNLPDGVVYDKGKIKVDNFTITFGNGSLKGVTSKSGLDFEQICIQDIIDLTKLIATPSNSESERNKLWKEEEIPSKYNYLKNLYLSGDLNGILKLLQSDPSTDLSEYVVSTGKRDSKLNNKGRLVDSDFIISNQDVDDVCSKTAEIIADITINKTKFSDDIYISNKLDSAQLSGINVQYVLNKNQTFRNSIESEIPYDQVPNNSDMIPFNNFCDELGLDREDFYNKFLYNKQQNLQDLNIKLVSNNHSSKQLTKLLLGLIGNNFWYITPTHSDYILINKKYINEPIKILSARIRASKSTDIRGLMIKAQIAQINFNFSLRTSGSGRVDKKDYPYRLFLEKIKPSQLCY